MKKILSLFLSILLLVGIVFTVPASALVTENKEFYYNILNEKYVEITGPGVFCSLDVVIPSEIDGYTVKYIGNDSFWCWEDSPKSFVFPDTVTYIGEDACQQSLNGDLYEESRLERIVLPDSLTYIGPRAFYGNVNLKELEIPESVVYIGKGAFSYNNKIKKLTIPATVRYIGEGAFSHWSKLEEVYIERGATNFKEKEIFYNCPKLKKIYMYDSFNPNMTADYSDNTFAIYNKKNKKNYVNKNLVLNIQEETGDLRTSLVSLVSKNGSQANYILDDDSTKLIKSDVSSIVTLKHPDKKVVKWISSNPKIAKISTKGKYTALKSGTTTLTATFEDGTTYTRKLKVYGNPKLSEKKITLKVGQTKKVKIFSKARGVNNVYKSTSKAKIIGSKKKDYFKVRGLKTGKTTLKVTANGVKLNLKVTVKSK